MVPIILEDKLKLMIKYNDFEGFLKIFIETENGKSVAYADRVLKRLDKRKKIPRGWKSAVKIGVRVKLQITKDETKLRVAKKAIEKVNKKTVTKEIPERDDWYCGFACAAGVVGLIDSPAAAQEVLRQSGVTRKQLEESGAEKYDISNIFGEDHENDAN